MDRRLVVRRGLLALCACAFSVAAQQAHPPRTAGKGQAAQSQQTQQPSQEQPPVIDRARPAADQMLESVARQLGIPASELAKMKQTGGIALNIANSRVQASRRPGETEEQTAARLNEQDRRTASCRQSCTAPYGSSAKQICESRC